MRFKLLKRTIGRCGFSLLLLLAALALPALAQPDNDTSKAEHAKLTLSARKLNFGDEIVTLTSASKTVTATNDSKTAAITITNIVVSSPFLKVGGTCGSSIPAGGTCDIKVAFEPTATGKVNQKKGLTFIDSAGKSPQHVELEGRGIIGPTPTPTLTATPTATPTPPFSVSGEAIQNGMNGAAITAVSVNSNGSDGSPLGSTTADGNGNFSMSISPPPSAPVRIRASGGSYVSEQNGATISSPSSLSVLLPGVQNNLSGLSINPLTTFVDSLAQGNISRGQILATALNNSRTSIENDYGISTDPLTLTPLYTPAAAGSDAGRLGLILGAIVNEDQLACASAPGGLVTALSSDISDGVFDGTTSGTPVSYCGGNLATIAGTTQFGDALSGLQQLALTTSGFTFGGINNELTLNGETAADAAADAAKIENALVATAPASVNTFATTTASMNTARAFAAATLLPNGKVLIAGGNNSLSSTDLYDPATNTFAAPADTAVMNSSRTLATATLLPNGKVLIAGGAAPATSSTDLYDPVSNTFAPPASTPVMNTARAAAAAILLPNGKVLIAGGQMAKSGGGFIFLSSTELYDPVSNTFAASTPSMNNPRVGPTATLLPNGKVLIAGGVDAASGALNTTDLYDPDSNTFAAPADTAVMNNTRYGGTSTLLPNGKVLIAGGEGPGGGSNLRSTELYDPATNTFAASAATPVMNTGRYQDTATLLPNGKVLIAGGTGDAGTLSSTELYNPASNTFAPSPPAMNAVRSIATATLLPNGKVLIAGGFDGIHGGIILSSTDLYTP